jgi:hypothetical protein
MRQSAIRQSVIPGNSILTILLGYYLPSQSIHVCRPANFNSSQLKTCNMKSKTMIAIIIAAALVILTYLLLFNNKKQQQPFNLAGEWVLDSAYTTQEGSDTSLEMLTGILSYTTNKPVLQFGPDSVLSGSVNDSTLTKYYLRDSLLYINEGKGFRPLIVKKMTDTLFEFVIKDSTVFVLKKK